jgi:hypothetical protein
MYSFVTATRSVMLHNLHPAYLHTLGAEPFPVEFMFTADRKVSTLHVYHNGSRLAHAVMLKNNTKFRFPMDPRNQSNAGEYEVVFDEDLASEYRQKTSLYLLLSEGLSTVFGGVQIKFQKFLKIKN